jgi:hypothetical protein
LEGDVAAATGKLAAQEFGARALDPRVNTPKEPEEK